MQIIKYCIKYSILALWVGMLFSCGNTKQELEEISFDETYPDETTKDITLYFSDSAKTKMVLTAPLVNQYHDQQTPYSEMPNGFEVTFYNKAGKPDSYIRAKEGRYYEKSKKVEAKNKVEVINSDGEKLNTEQLFWDQKKKKIYSDEFVKITSGDEIYYGNGLEANEDFSKYKIKYIKAIINVEEEEEFEKEVNDTIQ